MKQTYRIQQNQLLFDSHPISGCINNLRRKALYALELRDELAKQARLQEDLKRVRRGEVSGWIFIVIGVIFIVFGYTVYDSGIRYSGIFLMIMGIVSIAFGFVLIRYSRKIV